VGRARPTWAPGRETFGGMVGITWRAEQTDARRSLPRTEGKSILRTTAGDNTDGGGGDEIVDREGKEAPVPASKGSNT